MEELKFGFVNWSVYLLSWDNYPVKVWAQLVIRIMRKEKIIFSVSKQCGFGLSRSKLIVLSSDFLERSKLTIAEMSRLAFVITRPSESCIKGCRIYKPLKWNEILVSKLWGKCYSICSFHSISPLKSPFGFTHQLPPPQSCKIEFIVS